MPLEDPCREVKQESHTEVLRGRKISELKGLRGKTLNESRRESRVKARSGQKCTLGRDGHTVKCNGEFREARGGNAYWA